MNPPKADELDYIHFLIVSLGADILTGDEDFFGCGIATWTVDTLIPHLPVVCWDGIRGLGSLEIRLLDRRKCAVI